MGSTCLSGDNIICELKSLLEERIGTRKYRLWFNGSSEFIINDNRLTIKVRNNFVKGWIYNNFLNDIKQVMESIIGIKPEISIIVNESERKSEDSVESKCQSADDAILTPLATQNMQENISRLSQSNGRAYLRRKLRNSLDTFIVGPSNELAYNTIMSIVENVRSPFNPLFIYGGCGLGKTHLLQGLCNALSEQKPSVNWYYVSGEEFTNQFIVALKNNQLDAFRRRYRNVDVLVIDDVHFLANKRATQEEFLHTYNAINAAGKQVVMASDTHPRQIHQFHNSLIDRCISGMIVKIDPPDQITRAAIIKARSEILGQHLPDNVIQLIAHRVKGNVRELEGAILKLFAYSSLCNKPVNIEIAERVANEYGVCESKINCIDKIEKIVAKYFDVKINDIRSSKRKQKIALARAMIMYLARKHTNMSFPEIGKHLEKKNHSTVVLACQKIEKQLELGISVKWQVGETTKSMRINEIIAEIEEKL